MRIETGRLIITPAEAILLAQVIRDEYVQRQAAVEAIEGRDDDIDRLLVTAADQLLLGNSLVVEKPKA